MQQKEAASVSSLTLCMAYIYIFQVSLNTFTQTKLLFNVNRTSNIWPLISFVWFNFRHNWEHKLYAFMSYRLKKFNHTIHVTHSFICRSFFRSLISSFIHLVSPSFIKSDIQSRITCTNRLNSVCNKIMGWIKARKRGLKASPVSPGIRNCVSLAGHKRKFPGWFVNESTDIFFSRGQLKTVILTTVVVSFSSRYLFFVLMQIFVKKYAMVQWAPAVVATLMAVGIRRWTAVVLWWAVAGEILVKNALWQTQVKWNENREVSC